MTLNLTGAVSWPCQKTGDDRNEGGTERWHGGEVVKCSGAFV